MRLSRIFTYVAIASLSVSTFSLVIYQEIRKNVAPVNDLQNIQETSLENHQSTLSKLVTNSQELFTYIPNVYEKINATWDKTTKLLKRKERIYQEVLELQKQFSKKFPLSPLNSALVIPKNAQRAQKTLEIEHFHRDLRDFLAKLQQVTKKITKLRKAILIKQAKKIIDDLDTPVVSQSKEVIFDHAAITKMFPFLEKEATAYVLKCVLHRGTFFFELDDTKCHLSFAIAMNYKKAL